MTFQEQLNAWVKQGLCHDVTAIHFPRGKYPTFCNTLIHKIRYAEISDGCCILVQGNMPQSDLKQVVLDSYAPLRGNVPTYWGVFYIEEA